MKKLFFLTAFLLFIILESSAKKGNHLFTFSYSNDGQIKDVIDQFYFTLSQYDPNNDTYGYKQNELKLNFKYEYLLTNNYSFYCKAGYSKRKDSYNISNSSLSGANGSKEQVNLNFAVGARYNFKIDKIMISTGLEIPYFDIGKHTELLYDDAEQQKLDYSNTIDGGNVFGLNSITSLKLFLSNKLFIESGITIGFLSYNLGGNSEYFDGTFHYVNEITYRVNSFSKPEFEFGIGLKL